MKVIAALDANLETTWLGTASRLAQPLDDDTVLGRTVRRLARCTRLDGVYVLVPSEQYDGAVALLRDTPAIVRNHDAGEAPHIPLVRVARKWSLDGWRGGVGGAASFDEYTHPRLLAGLAGQVGADAVLCVPPAAPLVDPGLADAMVEHFCTMSEEMRMVFTLAPPGLVGTVYQTALLQEMAEKNIPPGWTLSYKPDAPCMDLTSQKCCFQSPEAMRHSVGRMVADTQIAFDRIRRCLGAHPDPDANTVGRWMMAQEADYVWELPEETELELTTEDQLLSTTLRPRGACVGRRGPLDVGVIRGVAAELAECDDARVVLGGFGEPLLHPKFGDVLAAIREAGVFGVALRTNGLGLADEAIEAIVAHQVDMVCVTLDATTPESYRRVHGFDGYELAVGNLERLVAARGGNPAGGAARPAVITPLVFPEMVKCRETVSQLDLFFDGWVRQVGWAVVSGYDRYGGRMADREVVNMTPPERIGCRRLQKRCMVTAGGDLLRCDQDFAAEYPVGNLGTVSLREMWRGSGMSAVREAHRGACYGAVPLCAECSEWHRP